MAGPNAALMSPGTAPRAAIFSSATPRMSPTELRQPQCTAPITPCAGSCSRAGTQSAVKQNSGRPSAAVTSPSELHGAWKSGAQRSASVITRTSVPCTCWVKAAEKASTPTARPRRR